MAPNDPLDPSAEADQDTEAGEDDLDCVEYYDDGEWHAVLLDGSNPVASGYGGSPEEARKSLFGTAEVD